MTAPSAPSADGYFIAFEGGDGAGKTTQAEHLGVWLRRKYQREVILTREPGGTPLGQVLRESVLHGEHVDARTEALLYATDRAHHVEELIRPSLARGIVVITDRYVDSSIAYQGAGRALDLQDITNLQRWATDGLRPQLTILLDVDPALGLSRLTGEAPDRLESQTIEFHQRVREHYLKLASEKPERYLVLDATESAQDLQQKIRARISVDLGL